MEKESSHTDISLVFDYLEQVNYALVLSKMNICNWCIIENDSAMTLDDIHLEIMGEYVETYTSMSFNLESHQRIRLQNITLQVNTSKLIALTEKVISTIVLRLVHGQNISKEQSFPISFLAYNQWHGISYYPQLLTSFITPNHPSIAQIVKRASEHLYELCASKDFTGYLSQNKQLVIAQIEAIYLSLQEEGISFSLSMPSYETEGQRIRLAGEVLNDKLGNCMDLTLLFAACLEYIGINTLLIMEAEHIYIGAWLIPYSHIRSVDDDWSFLHKKTAEGVDDILMIESTMFAKAEMILFDVAREAAFMALKGDGNFQLFLDVYRCRLEGFHPLPQIVKRNDMWVLSEESKPMDRDERSVFPEDKLVKEESTKPTKQLLWERKLLDFTMRNTLLNVKMSSALQLMSVNLKDIVSKMFELNKGLRIDEVPNSLELKVEEEMIIDSQQMDMNMLNLIKDDIKNGRLHSYLNDDETTEKLKKLRRIARTMIEENGANSLFMSLGLMQWLDDAGNTFFAPILMLPVDFTYKNQIYHVKLRGEDMMLNITLFEYLKQTFEIEFDGLTEIVNSENGLDIQKLFALIREGLVKKPHWNVLEECMIGIFSFNKFVLWNDIHSYSEEMRKHPIIDALMETEHISTVEQPSEDLDKKVQPSELCAPLPYDFSQLSAIVASEKGKSFILHGPPGTGKSQTITNMITNALYHGKRVLFVAEKMAALSVVQHRLEKLGLGNFCLELHSNKATKRHLIQQLSELIGCLDKADVSVQHLALANKLYSQRKELMQHVDALHHCESDDDFSIYECIMHYCRFNGDGMLEMLNHPTPHITPHNLAEYEYYIDRLSAIIQLIGQPSKHPLRGLKTNAQTMLHFGELKSLIGECSTSIIQLKAVIDELSHSYDDVMPDCLGDIAQFMGALKEMHQKRKTVLNTASNEIFAADIAKLEQKRQVIQHSNYLTGRIKKWALLKEVKSYHANVKWNTLDEFIILLSELEGNALHKKIDVNLDLERFLTLYDDYQCKFDKLHSWLEIEQWQSLTTDKLKGYLNNWSAHLDKLKDWKQWCIIKEDLCQKNMGVVTELMEHQETSIPNLKNKFFARYFYDIVSKKIAENPTADMFNGMLFDEKVNHYKDLAKNFQKMSKEELFNRLMAKVKAVNDNTASSNQLVMLHKAISNNGRGLTIRRLFELGPDILAQFCPCMLMSPMSVAQYLNMEKDMFDLVIFDEASQIPTNEAVGAIARGKTIVIVGDSKQMPPTSFFVNNKTTEEEFDVDDLESILEDCHALKMPTLLLSWHYRSRHESLITFSNNEYYENKLNTFPAIDDQERRVVYVPVKGTYLKGGSRSNQHEAIAIVDEIERRLNDEQLRKLSIGVISFNVQQQYLIEDILETRMEKNRKLKIWAEESGEPIFVKNLENVQGDERDVILFSIGYGPDKSGKISMNFGPLNLVGGERRLNVAITRSRYEMMVFSSLHARDIDLRRTNAKGVQGLRRFLDYAENGTLIANVYHEEKPVSEKIITQQIAKRLEERGLIVSTFVGKSRFKVNIAVHDPEKDGIYMMGILLDDKMYQAIPTMSDREIVLPTVLEFLDWRIKRIWILDWFERPEHVIDNILSEIEKIKQL